MFTEFTIAIGIFLAVVLLLFRSRLRKRWRFLVQQTVASVLLIWLLAVGWVAF